MVMRPLRLDGKNSYHSIFLVGSNNWDSSILCPAIADHDKCRACEARFALAGKDFICSHRRTAGLCAVKV